ncbi:hypothetical protein HPP92_009134 [Vanilla planifolia]|uniref:Methyltransferase type 11 domain-containing protein n=1 Tax=Vanilla planifolia TaxID=51239 RepID=A0A835RBT5_VANPL|nr:hypothetical protein HPP92_009134 [Vanilla planifolia]
MLRSAKSEILCAYLSALDEEVSAVLVRKELREQGFIDYVGRSLDSLFYSEPRFVTHIDDPAISALTKYYSKVFPPSNTPGVCLLDMCSSWVLTEYIVQDLNVNPKLPFEDSSFDVITNVVSVDYLTKPIAVFKEMQRILKPEGLAIISFSNRCFWTKAISIWTSTGDSDHAWIVGSYFHYAGGFEPPLAVDISPNPGRSDQCMSFTRERRHLLKVSGYEC